jgi:O-antigen ligase
MRLPSLGAEFWLAAAAAAATALLAFLGIHKLGTAGLLLPLALALVAILITRPVMAMALLVVLTSLCEGPSFGLFSFTSNLYDSVYGDLTVLDLFVLLAVAAVAVDVLRHRRPVWVPRALTLPLATLALAMIAGVVTGHASGASFRFAIFSENVFAYLLFVPIAVANLDLDRRQLTRLLGGAVALAVLKAVLGLIEVFGHLGLPIEGTTDLSYYEPAANWLVMIAVLSIFAMAVARAKPPLWVLLGSPLLVACLVLSYRRSFWIGAVLGLLVVLLVATSPNARRLLVPAALGVAAAIWLLGSIGFQSQLPIAKRLASLSPTKLEANVQDRYRLDERANVLGEIREHPITGLGVTIPWAATVRPLSIEHEGGREYVHFAALYFWLKLGLLGLLAYVAVMLGCMTVAWQAWRASREPLLKAFALGSLGGMVGLVVMDTTATFTGGDARFTVLFTAQVGLLALARRAAGHPDPPDGEPATEERGAASSARGGAGGPLPITPAWS